MHDKYIINDIHAFIAVLYKYIKCMQFIFILQSSDTLIFKLETLHWNIYITSYEKVNINLRYPSSRELI